MSSLALKKAMIWVKRGNDDERIDVMFNPSEYSLDSSNKFHWQRVQGLSQPIAQFISGEATSLSMELFFDTYEQGTDVRKKTMQIVSLLEVDQDSNVPPICEFVWGSLQFRGIVEKVMQRYTMFLDSGLPVRATLQVTFRSVQGIVEQFKEIPRQSADQTKQRTIKQGDQLWQIAAEEYDDPTLWREIATANGIENPSQLVAGTILIIPRLYG